MVPSTPVTPRSVLFSSDEEYRTASEGGRRESGEWSEMPISPPLTRNGEWALALKGSNWPDQINHEWSELPPSPPLTRTALSRVKARSRSSSRSRGYKRSRSSPPSSRRSTLDSVRSEDLMMAWCELGEDEEQTNGCLTGSTDNPLIVELLESQVSMLRDQLDQNQSHPSTLLVVIERQENEIEELKSQLNDARNDIASAEKELARLRQQKVEASIREKQVDELLNTIQRTEQQRNKHLEDLDKVKKLYNRDKEMLECKLLETEAILRETAERCEMLTNELSSSHMTVEHLQNEISALSDRLSQGIEENEQLYTRVRELEGRSGLSAARERGRSFDSLSDLTNIDMDLDLTELDKERMIEEYEELRGRFEKAISEIRAMRRELREAHATQDALELEILAHRQDAARCRDSNQAQVQLMAARIQDLTNKLTASEKQVRAIKQKLLKAESRDKRRSLSLKGRESFQISQELEEKLLELENKICAIECGTFSVSQPSAGVGSKESSPNPKRERKRENKSLDRARIRRKSLDSATSSEPMKVLIRLSTLETKVASVSENLAATSDVEKDSSESSEILTPSNDISVEILSRLKKFERTVSKAKRRLERCLGSTQAEEKAEKCLREVNDILESCGDCKKNQSSVVNSQTQESVGIVVSRLESIIKDKMSELTKRRLELKRNGQLDDKEKLKLIAERIAFESVVLGQIKKSINGKKTFDKFTVLSELVETSQLISNLKFKVKGTKTKIYQNTSYIQYLTRVLANKLILVGGGVKQTTNTDNTDNNSAKEVLAARCESFNYLIRQQKEVADLVDRYKESKLGELASALAAETLSMSDQEDLQTKQSINTGTTKLLEDRRIREAWAQAQETVSRELVRSEVSHVMTKCGQDYEQNITSVSDLFLNFEASERSSLESWADAAQAKFRHEMETSIEELSNAYEESLTQMKKRNRIVSESKYESRQMLVEFADVIAQKALIDARIDTLQQNNKFTVAYPGETFVSSLIENEDILAKLVDDDYKFESNPHMDAEYTYLYQQFSKDCAEKISGKHQTKEQIKNVAQSLACLEEDLASLGMTICGDKIDANNFAWSRSNSLNISEWPNIYEKFNELRKRVKRIGDYAHGFSCKQCNQLQETIQRLRNEHNDELVDLRRSQEKDLMEIKGELDNQRYSLTSQYEHEAATLRERARKLENRLNAMDSEHSAHVNELRAAYQRSISAELDTDAETRKRYKEEIKQLRGLCEKGLLAMENSHRRIISEMEDKHRQELESLKLEKEQALSEETQATLAALDAMRKAHEHEVQKEITKFKQEFMKQMQAREDIGALHKEHE